MGDDALAASEIQLMDGAMLLLNTYCTAKSPEPGLAS